MVHAIVTKEEAYAMIGLPDSKSYRSERKRLKINMELSMVKKIDMLHNPVTPVKTGV
jgi:hypothetical protein